MRFSRTRRSPGQSMTRIPPCQRRWRATQAIWVPDRSSQRAAAGWGPRSLIPADAKTPTARPATGALLGQVVLSMPIVAHTTCADFRCAPGRFAGCAYRPRLLPGTTGRQGRWPFDAGAQTDLSCPVLGCGYVPIPLRRRVPWGCDSKLFAPSVAFALSVGARLPLWFPPNGGHAYDAAGFN